MPEDLASAAQWIGEARSIAVLTGAGVSAESGVPTFRGKEGLWRRYRAEELATPEAYRMLGIAYLIVAAVRTVSMFLDKSVEQSNIISVVVEIVFGVILVL